MNASDDLSATLIQLAQRYMCEVASLSSLATIEQYAVRKGDRTTATWVRRRMNAIEYLADSDALTTLRKS